jgi:hypothetical protein
MVLFAMGRNTETSLGGLEQMSHFYDLYIAYLEQAHAVMIALTGFTVLLLLGWFIGCKMFPPSWVYRFQIGFLIWCAVIYAGLLIYAVR